MNNVDVFGKAYQMLRVWSMEYGVRWCSQRERRMEDGRKVWGDSTRYILDEMLPDDVVEEDTETQAGWRAEVMEVISREDTVELQVKCGEEGHFKV